RRSGGSGVRSCRPKKAGGSTRSGASVPSRATRSASRPEIAGAPGDRSPPGAPDYKKEEMDPLSTSGGVTLRPPTPEIGKRCAGDSTLHRRRGCVVHFLGVVRGRGSFPRRDVDLSPVEPRVDSSATAGNPPVRVGSALREVPPVERQGLLRVRERSVAERPRVAGIGEREPRRAVPGVRGPVLAQRVDRLVESRG